MIGTTIDQYRIEERLGGGGMGEVFRARDLELERSVAIKCVRPDLSDLDEVTVRFRAEARTLAGLAHSNIATVFRFFPHDGTLYLVMEYISGQPFGDLLRDHGAQPADEVVRLLSQTLAGLGYAHENKVVHRDIKPGNLMLDRHNTVKVLDFGIAHLLDQSRITQSGSVLGTPAYMAPEQVLGQPVDGRTDLYALGVVLFEMLTGKLPFQATSQFELMRAHLETQPRSLKAMTDTVPRPLQHTVVRALAKESDERFQSAAEFSHALEVALGESIDGGYHPGTIADAVRSPVKVVVGRAANASSVPESSPTKPSATVDRHSTEVSQANSDDGAETAVRPASSLPTSIEIPLPEPKKAAGYGLAAVLLVGVGVLIATLSGGDSSVEAPQTLQSSQSPPAASTTPIPSSAVERVGVPGQSSVGENTSDATNTPANAVVAGAQPKPASTQSVAPASRANTTAAPSVSRIAPSVQTQTAPSRTVAAPRVATPTPQPRVSSGSYVVRATKVSAHERQGTGFLSRSAGYNGSFALSAPQGAQPLQIEEFIEVYRDGVQMSRQLIHSQNRRPGRFKSKQRIPGLKELAAGNYRLRLVFESERRQLGSHEWSLTVTN